MFGYHATLHPCVIRYTVFQLLNMSSLNCFSVGQTNFRAKLLKLMLGSDPEVEIIPLAWIKDLGRESGDSSVCFDKFPCKIPDLDKMLKEKVLEKY